MIYNHLQNYLYGILTYCQAPGPSQGPGPGPGQGQGPSQYSSLKQTQN